MEVNIKKISTENQNKDTKNIDIVSTEEKIRLINQQDKSVAIAVEKEINNIAKITDAAIEAIKAGGRVIYIGAGTSGRLGILDASEMLPTYGEKDWFLGVIAGGSKAVVNPVENAEDNMEQAVKDLEALNVSEKDLIVGIAASGRTPYVISALNYAEKIGAKSASISTSSNAEISKIAKISVEAVVGAETITGSTRMKSGTAQKMILNMISTATMVSLGKTFENLMVDVKPTNEKLVWRAIKMIEKITGASEDEAKNLFEESGQNVKIASVMYAKKISKNEAIDLLNKSQGSLRVACES